MRKRAILSPQEVIDKFLNWFTKDKRKLFLVTFIVGFMINILVITNDIVTTDAISLGEVYIANAWDFSLGRWFLKFSETVRFGLASSVVTSIFSLVLLSLTIVLIIDLFKMKSNLSKYLIVFLFVCAPFFTDTLLSVYCAPDFTLAFFLSVLCVYLLYHCKNKWSEVILPGILLSFLLGLYQAYLGVVCGLCLLVPITYGLRQLEPKKKISEKLVKSICMGLLGLILYELILHLFLGLLGIKMASYGGANQIGITTLLEIPKHLRDSYVTFYNYFMNNEIINNFIYQRQIVHGIFFAVTIILVIKQLKKNKSKYTFVGVTLGILLLPLALGILEVIAPNRPLYSLMSAPYMLIYVFGLSLMEDIKLTHEKLISWIMILSTLYIANSYFIMTNATYMAVRITKEKTINAAQKIADSIYALDDYQDNMKVLFIGRAEGKYFENSAKVYELANSIALYDPLMWKEPLLCNRGWHNIMRYYLGINFIQANLDNYEQIIESNEYKEMKSYPYSSFVKIIKDTIIVKIIEVNN